MLILSLDTSSMIASAALCLDGKIIATCEKNSNMNHSCTVLPVVAQMLEREEICMGEIDVFASSIGPGSFTGIRIGVAAIKGYAWTMKKPCVGVSTLLSCAWAARDFCGIICGAIKARENEFFFALFKSDGKTIERITDDCVETIEIITQKLAELSCEIFVSGDNSEEFVNLCKALGFDNISYSKLCVQSAASTALCAHKMANDGELVSVHELTPSYLRLSQAEQALKNREGK